MGQPRDTKDYNKFENEDVKVYVKSDIKAKDDILKIKHSKMLWMERLVVEGII